MTDFQSQWAKRREKWSRQEEQRVGDIYDECIKHGCDLRFLQTFDTRMSLYPLEQTHAFLDAKERTLSKPDTEKRLEQWKIFLRVMIEKRPDDAKTADRKESLELLE